MMLAVVKLCVILALVKLCVIGVLPVPGKLYAVFSSGVAVCTINCIESLCSVSFG